MSKVLSHLFPLVYTSSMRSIFSLLYWETEARRGEVAPQFPSRTSSRGGHLVRGSKADALSPDRSWLEEAASWYWLFALSSRKASPCALRRAPSTRASCCQPWPLQPSLPTSCCTFLMGRCWSLPRSQTWSGFSRAFLELDSW